jgi:8-oxo-dGTP diphosphatase
VVANVTVKDHEKAPEALVVVAAAIVVAGRLLVVSKKSAPDLFYLPGGKPEPGEKPLQTLARELAEELAVSPVAPDFLMEVQATAALENVPMRMSVFRAGLSRPPRPAAELAQLRWIDSRKSDVRLAPAVTDHLLPWLRRAA